MSTTIRIHAVEASPVVRMHSARLAADDQLKATRISILRAGLPWREERRAMREAMQAYRARLTAIAGAYSRARYMGRI